MTDADATRTSVTSDERIGSNARQSRENAGLSQTAVAEAMRTRGFKWTQPTVVSVEKGERPLHASEAADLARILRLASFDELLGEPVPVLPNRPGIYHDKHGKPWIVQHDGTLGFLTVSQHLFTPPLLESAPFTRLVPEGETK